MDLFFSPMASCLASRITSYESGIHLDFIEVEPVTKQTPGGRNYLEISPLGLLPALRLHDGFLLTGDYPILQHLAASSTTSNLVPLRDLDLDRLHQWLFMLGTELRHMVSVPLLDKKAADGTATHMLDFVVATLDFLNDQLTERQFLLNRFSISDAYLCSVLNSTSPTGIDLSPWPAIEAYYDRLLKRPSVSGAIAEELALRDAELARHRSSCELSLGGFA
jgi:glutathione S-transferase